MPIEIGSRLDAYEIVAALPGDGLGDAYRATDTRLDRPCRLWVSPLPIPDDGPARLRTVGAALARAPHASLLEIDGFAVADGRCYVTSRPPAGATLAERLERGGPMASDDLRTIAAAILGALRHLHGLGLAHGAVTPARVIVTPERVALLDAGVGALLPSLDALPWHPSLSCMAPERFRGARADASADLFSLGVLLYRALTGAMSFAIETRDVFLDAVARGPVPHAALPPRLASALRALLAVEPTVREAGLAGLDAWLENQASSRSRAPARTEEQASGLHEPESPVYGLDAQDNVGVVPPDAAAPQPTHARFIENGQFTVFRPRAIAPGVWATLLAFAHLAERAPDAPPGEPDPVEEVRAQARRVLGASIDRYAATTQDARDAIPAFGEIALVPTVDGVEFNPPSRTFRWTEAVHREEFRLRASAALDGQTARGRLTAFCGGLVVAEVGLAIRVDSAQRAAGETAESTARPYRRIFASYSHLDREVVEQLEAYAAAIGDRYLRDVTELRAGEVWGDRLAAMVREADVFQLFWSSNAMRSPYVRQEWEYALSLGRAGFVRPTYWEEPLPEAPELDLPPSTLRRLHFQRLPLASRAAPSPHAPVSRIEPVGEDESATSPACAQSTPPAPAAPTREVSPDRVRPIEPMPPPPVLRSSAPPLASSGPVGGPPPAEARSERRTGRRAVVGGLLAAGLACIVWLSASTMLSSPSAPPQTSAPLPRPTDAVTPVTPRLAIERQIAVVEARVRATRAAAPTPLSPGEIEVGERYVQRLIASADYARAESDALRLVASDPRGLRHWASLATIYAKLGRRDEAAAALALACRNGATTERVRALRDGADAWVREAIDLALGERFCPAS